MKQPVRLLLSGLLASSMVLTPAIALAQNYVNFEPLQPTTSYTQPSSAYQSYSATPSYVPANEVTTMPYNGTDSNVQLKGRISTIPRGTMMMVHLDHPVSSESAHLGDTVTATLENDIFIGSTVVIPAGSEVTGQVASVNSAGRLGKHGDLDIRFHSVKAPGGNMLPVRAHIVTSDNRGVLKGDSFKMELAKGIGIAGASTGVGALAGTAVGGMLGAAGSGALMGLSMGAIGGMGYAIARKGKDVVVPSSTRMSLVIDQDVSVSP